MARSARRPGSSDIGPSFISSVIAIVECEGLCLFLWPVRRLVTIADGMHVALSTAQYYKILYNTPRDFFTVKKKTPSLQLTTPVHQLTSVAMALNDKNGNASRNVRTPTAKLAAPLLAQSCKRRLSRPTSSSTLVRSNTAVLVP